MGTFYGRVHLATIETVDQIKPASMSSAIDLASLTLGDVATTGKGAKQIHLTTIGGEAPEEAPGHPGLFQQIPHNITSEKSQASRQ